MRKTTGAVIALPIIAFALATAGVIPSAQASGDRTPEHTQTLRFTDKAITDTNTDVDLGKPGPSAGDQQIFQNVLYQGGRQVGTSAGVAEVIALTATTLTAQVLVTATIPGGTLTLQFAFTENLADGPPTTMHQAITGGTGQYRGARGECQTTSINNTDDSTITCTLTAGD
jgi:hypothetical protein